MSSRKLFRESLRRIVPPWLSERVASGAVVGFRTLQAMIAPLDDATDRLVQGVQAAWPGRGTPTALALIGRSRGIIRGRGESDFRYGKRLAGWLDRWRIAGSQEAIARSIHEYVQGNPRVRVVNRAGTCISIDPSGALTRDAVSWDWDSKSNAERAGYWSEVWVVVYTPPWSESGPQLNSPGAVLGSRTTGLGHLVVREEVDAIRGLLAQWKSAHSFVRAVIFTYDASLFDPVVPSSWPNGRWGQWSAKHLLFPGSRVSSDRSASCRFWEPDSEPDREPDGEPSQ